MAERNSERDDDWHRREYVRRLHQNRERGLAGGPVPTVEEIQRRERGLVSQWLQPQPQPTLPRPEHAHGRSLRWKALRLVAAGVALGAVALAYQQLTGGANW